jgi:2-amino-4-hydroxy-6-hydroxymethyldihydropteridine diphosphokinase
LAQDLTPIAISLGSNQGDRAGHLDHAVARLTELGTIHGIIVSAYLETAPAPPAPAGSPPFLNAALAGRTPLSPHALLDRLLAIERERGRTRPVPGAARPLDLDLILFGDVILAEPRLRIPHPRFRERRFVLEPLASIAPEMVDPETGITIGQLLEQVRARN